MSNIKGGKAPAPPDYEAAARAQGQANLEAIRTGAALNRVNQVTPYGKVTYRQVQPSPNVTTQPVSTPNVSLASVLAGTGWSGQRWGDTANQITLPNPVGTSASPSVPASDQWEQITELSPDQQAILDAQEGNQIDMGRIANQRLNQFGDMGPLDYSGLPSRVTGVNPSNFQTNVISPGTRYSDIDLSRLSGFGNANVQNGLDFSGAPARADAQYQMGVDLSGLPEIPGINDFGAERQKVEDAVYGRATRDLDPQFQQREEAMRTSLINSGNVEGSEAWKNEMGNFERERQNAYDQARNSAILAGGNEQSRLLADALASRSTMSGERFGQGNFANTAANAANSYGLNARGQSTAETTTAGNFANQAAGQVNDRADSNRSQQLAEILTQGQFGNQAAYQNLQAELAKLGLINSAESDRFAQGVTNANLTNSARDAGVNERLTERSLPLQEFLSLYGGGGGSGFQAPSIPQAGTPEAPDLLGATQAGYQGRLDQYSANQARNAQNQQSVMQLAALLAMSDRRAKRDIERIGALPNGLPTYRFKFLDGDREHIGVMADEVREIFPDAVIRGFDGYDRVNYAAIGAEHLLELH